MNLPLTGWPMIVIEPLHQIVSMNIRRRVFDEFYIGRTVDIMATRCRHGCDAIFPLYETTSAGNAMAVEDALIKLLNGHPKCSNDNQHCGGGVSDDYINYVYLALWCR